MSSPHDLLAQLERYLEQDRDNDGLRAEAFEAALRGGLRERAEAHLRAGLDSGRDAPAWQLRHAHWLMAGHDWHGAKSVLAALHDEPRAPTGSRAAAAHDLALVALREGDPATGRQWLQPLVQAADPAPAAALQALWLRLLHHLGEIDEALNTARRWAKTGLLAPEAAGVASLAALDANEFADGTTWSAQALQALPQQLEALVTQGSLALARQDAPGAMAMLGRALAVQPRDGRALSAMATGHLLAGDLARARQCFDAALPLLPRHIGTRHGLGWTCLIQGDAAAARRAFEQALALDRNFADSHGGLACALARAGERAAAEQEAAISLRLDPRSMSAHYARAILDGHDQDAPAMQALARRLLSERSR